MLYSEKYCMPIRTSITGFPQCLQFSRACKKQRNKQKTPFEITRFTSAPHLRKREHCTQPPALPSPRRQERGHVRKLAAMGSTSKDIPQPDRELAGRHNVFHIKYHPQFLESQLPPTLADRRQGISKCTYTHDCFVLINLRTNFSIPSTRGAVSINHKRIPEAKRKILHLCRANRCLNVICL